MDGKRDVALELAAHELSDKQQLRRALDQLVESCRAAHPDDPALVPALLFAQHALDDTSHEGWMRRMRERREREIAAKIAECARDGHHQVNYTYMEPPRCDHCEQFIH